MQEDVLVVLRRCGRPLSAYAVLGELRGTHPRIAPPTIYRALAALMKQGRVHRLESMKAFIACQCDRPSNASILSICDDCGIVEERTAPGVLEEISVIAGASGFRAARHVIEVHGTCASCGTERASA
ncbi:MAG: transcriptional repressor [Alphaproteobacteria bacterium]|nr:transcriptional repressor [Alphaproteobacteria bacterium]